MAASRPPASITRFALVTASPAFRLIAAAVCLAAAGCSSSIEAPSATAPTTLRIGFPLATRESTAGVGLSQVLRFVTSEGLVRVERDGSNSPQLAERWEPVDGGSALRIHLRSGVRFTDGTELTADHVKASLDESRTDPAHHGQYPTLGEIASIDVEGPSTLLIHLAGRSAFLLDDLEVPITRGDGDGRPVGVGPFEIESVSDARTTLRANAHYYAGRPRIDAIVASAFPTLRTAWTAMLRDEIDFLWAVPNDAREFIEGQSGVRVFSLLRPYVYVLVYNVRRPVFVSASVRAALSLAVDRAALVDRALGGYAIPATGPIWPLRTPPADIPAGAGYDPVRAGAMLDQSGYRLSAGDPETHMPARLRFTAVVPAGVRPIEQIALALEKSFFDIGVDMRIEEVPVETFVARAGSGQFDALLVDINQGPGLVRQYRFWHSRVDPPAWNSGYRGADAALDALRQAFDPGARRRAISGLARAFESDPPAIFLCWPEVARAVGSRFEVPATTRDIVASIHQWVPRPRTTAGTAGSPR